VLPQAAMEPGRALGVLGGLPGPEGLAILCVASGSVALAAQDVLAVGVVASASVVGECGGSISFLGVEGPGLEGSLL